MALTVSSLRRLVPLNVSAGSERDDHGDSYRFVRVDLGRDAAPAVRLELRLQRF